MKQSSSFAMKVLLVLAVLLLAAIVQTSAQTTTTSDLVWEFADSAATPAVVGGYTQAVTLDNVLQTGVPTCVARPGGVGTRCSLTVPKVDQTKPHTFRVAVSAGGITKTLEVAGIDFSKGPADPAGGSINVLIRISFST